MKWRRILQRATARADVLSAEAGSERPAKDFARLPDEDDARYLARLVDYYLPTDVAATWSALVRPALRLTPAGPGDRIVARLGGDPWLPEGTLWPTWEGHGPLSFVAEVDLGALADLGLDAGIPLPTTGRMCFFYFDGSYDDFNGIVGHWDTSSLAGARMLHITADECEGETRIAAPGVPVFPERSLTARQILTAPNWEHPTLTSAFDASDTDHQKWMQHPVNTEPFVEALWNMHEGEARHQIGGWADPDQGPVELEVAHADLGLGDDYTDRRRETEAKRWTLLLQVDSEDDMMWGDVGKLYWLARQDDLALGQFDAVSFTWQCG